MEEIMQDLNQMITDNQQNRLLLEYLEDLTEKAERHLLKPVIGRAREIRLLQQTVQCYEKNNVIIVGDPQSGKSSVIRGLVLATHEANQHPQNQRTRIYQLKLSSLFASVASQSVIVENLMRSLTELSRSHKVILVIDANEAQFNTQYQRPYSDLQHLKDLFCRQEIPCVIEATHKMAHQMEALPGLISLFSPLRLEAYTVEQCVEILKHSKQQLELHHRVRISDEAISRAVYLSLRYSSDRPVIGSALSVLDLVAVKVKQALHTKPSGWSWAEKRRLEIRQSVVTTETAAEDLKLYQGIVNFMAAKVIVEQIRLVHQQLLSAKYRGDLAMVADIEYVRLPALNKQYEPYLKAGYHFASDEVFTNDVDVVMTEMTGIPVATLQQSEKSVIQNMEVYLHKRIIGQDNAVTAVADAVRRHQSGLSNPKKPIANLLFLGPTGVGKTELCKALAECLFHDEQSLIRFDMTEYSSKYNASRLIGAPPGLVGYDEGGQLTNAVRKKPYAVVLFDEIEKAHQDARNFLLQVMDEGHLTDSQGTKVDFRQTIIVMTSNLISEHSVRREFRPEFVNRIDATIEFLPLKHAQILEITRLQMKKLQSSVKENHKMTLSVTDAAIKKVAQLGYDPTYGARPLMRVINDKIISPLSREIVRGKLLPGAIFYVDCRDESLILQQQNVNELAMPITLFWQTKRDVQSLNYDLNAVWVQCGSDQSLKDKCLTIIRYYKNVWFFSWRRNHADDYLVVLSALEKKSSDVNELGEYFEDKIRHYAGLGANTHGAFMEGLRFCHDKLAKIQQTCVLK